MADVIIYPSSELDGPIRVMSPDGRVLSPDILKRIIEGHEASDIFDELSEEEVVEQETNMDDKKSTAFVKKLSKNILRLVEVSLFGFLKRYIKLLMF